MVRILETTIRDGSYEVGFQYTQSDVAVLGSLLDAAGFAFIEVGHGNGLGGEVFGQEAAATDEEYLRVARKSVKRAKLGAIVGFSKRSEEYLMSRIQLACDTGLDFIRLGFVPSKSDDQIIKKAIRLAKDGGLIVSLNYMRTYCAPPEELQERAKRALDQGVDWLYVVDSAGGMTPDEVKRYVSCLRETGASEVGFHGHNNTASALSNSLAAIDAGVTLLDTSIQGLGRATGNAQTEILLTLLQTRYDAEQQVDRNLVYKLARSWVRPRIESGFEPSYALSGALNVHSSSLGELGEKARSNGVELDSLLAMAGKRASERGAPSLEPKNLPADIVDDCCATLREQPPAATADLASIAKLSAECRQAAPTDLEGLVAELKVLALRDHLAGYIVLAPKEYWPYEGAGIARRGPFAFGLLQPSTDDLAKLAELPEWVRGVIVADELEAASQVPASTIDVMFVDVLAEATVLGLVPGSTLLAVSDPRLLQSLEGRLALRSFDRATSGGELGNYANVIVEGELGASVLEQLAARESKGDVLTILGTTSMPAGVSTYLESASLRIPDVFAPLVSRLLSRHRLNFSQSSSNSSEPHVWAGYLVDPAQTTVGRWLAAPASSEAPSASQVQEVIEKLLIADLIA